jgi:hypothetical protein
VVARRRDLTAPCTLQKIYNKKKIEFSIGESLIFKKRELNKTSMDFQKNTCLDRHFIDNHLPKIKENI